MDGWSLEKIRIVSSTALDSEYVYVLVSLRHTSLNDKNLSQ